MINWLGLALWLAIAWLAYWLVQAWMDWKEERQGRGDDDHPGGESDGETHEAD
jgi:hypothetical protein